MCAEGAVFGLPTRKGAVFSRSFSFIRRRGVPTAVDATSKTANTSCAYVIVACPKTCVEWHGAKGRAFLELPHQGFQVVPLHAMDVLPITDGVQLKAPCRCDGKVRAGIRVPRLAVRRRGQLKGKIDRALIVFGIARGMARRGVYCPLVASGHRTLRQQQSIMAILCRRSAHSKSAPTQAGEGQSPLYSL
jgi:hypothetical protein